MENVKICVQDDCKFPSKLITSKENNHPKHSVKSLASLQSSLQNLNGVIQQSIQDYDEQINYIVNKILQETQRQLFSNKQDRRLCQAIQDSNIENIKRYESHFPSFIEQLDDLEQEDVNKYMDAFYSVIDKLVDYFSKPDDEVYHQDKQELVSVDSVLNYVQHQDQNQSIENQVKELASQLAQLDNLNSDFQNTDWQWSDKECTSNSYISRHIAGDQEGHFKINLIEPKFKPNENRSIELKIISLESTHLGFWLVDLTTRKEIDGKFEKGIGKGLGTYGLYNTGWIQTSDDPQLNDSYKSIKIDIQKKIRLTWLGNRNIFRIEQESDGKDKPKSFELPVMLSKNMNADLYFAIRAQFAKVEIVQPKEIDNTYS